MSTNPIFYSNKVGLSVAIFYSASLHKRIFTAIPYAKKSIRAVRTIYWNKTAFVKKISIFHSQNQHNMAWSARLIKNNSENRIAIYFEKNQDLIARIKQIAGARWSQQKTVWHIPDTIENRERFKIEPLANSLPSAEGILQIEKFKQWLRSKRYSESTISTYSEALKSFLIFYREKSVVEINNEDVIIYNNEYILKNNLSASYQNQTVNAIKLYFMTVRETKIEVKPTLILNIK